MFGKDAQCLHLVEGARIKKRVRRAKEGTLQMFPLLACVLWWKATIVPQQWCCVCQGVISL